MKKRTAIAITVTTIWATAFSVLVYSKRGSVADLPLNAWGDFFAGAVAPLALFWLIVGYFQQGEELEQNTSALLAQQQELARQVEETRALVANADRQAKAAEQMALAQLSDKERREFQDRAQSMMLLQPEGGGTIPGGILVRMRNVGSIALDITLEVSAGSQITFQPTDALDSGQIGEMRITSYVEYPFRVRFGYRSKLGEVLSNTYEFVEPYRFRQRHDA